MVHRASSTKGRVTQETVTLVEAALEFGSNAASGLGGSMSDLKVNSIIVYGDTAGSRHTASSYGSYPHLTSSVQLRDEICIQILWIVCGLNLDQHIEEFPVYNHNINHENPAPLVLRVLIVWLSSCYSCRQSLYPFSLSISRVPIGYFL